MTKQSHRVSRKIQVLVKISRLRFFVSLLTGPLTRDFHSECIHGMRMRRNANKIEGEAIAKSATRQSYRDIGDLKTRKKQVPIL